MKTIVAGLDFSPLTPRVADYSIMLAAKCGAKVIFVHVLNAMPVLTEYWMPDVVSDRDAAAEESRLLQRLREYASQADRAGVAADVQLLKGVEAKGILQIAREAEADLIVLGTHGHGALHDIFGSSVAQAVTKAAQFPVLIVPPLPATAAITAKTGVKVQDAPSDRAATAGSYEDW